MGVNGDLAKTRAFFGPRAAGWEDRFPDDEPVYARAIADLAPPVGGAVLDVACGTGRALPLLRAAVGPAGVVLGLDLTAEMLAEAGRKGRSSLVLGDARALPLRDGVLDAVFAAGLLPHVRATVLAELRRVCRPGGRLALFHPISREALARKHGHEPDPDDVRASPHISARSPTRAGRATSSTTARTATWSPPSRVDRVERRAHAVRVLVDGERRDVRVRSTWSRPSSPSSRQHPFGARRQHRVRGGTRPGRRRHRLQARLPREVLFIRQNELGCSTGKSGPSTKSPSLSRRLRGASSAQCSPNAVLRVSSANRGGSMKISAACCSS
jgi:SAM-dependent methyltransferase